MVVLGCCWIEEPVGAALQPTGRVRKDRVGLLEEALFRRDRSA